LVLAELASGRAAGADDSAFVGEDDDLDAVAEVELGEDGATWLLTVASLR
jgi:hypothetical protein